MLALNLETFNKKRLILCFWIKLSIIVAVIVADFCLKVKNRRLEQLILFVETFNRLE